MLIHPSKNFRKTSFRPLGVLTPQTFTRARAVPAVKFGSILQNFRLWSRISPQR